MVAFILTNGVGFGQEYDDLYFNKSNREKQKVEKAQAKTVQLPAQEEPAGTDQNDFKPVSFLGKQYDVEPLPEDLAVVRKAISQESYDFYKPDKTVKDYTNPSFSTPRSTNQMYNNKDLGQNQSNPNFSDPTDTYQNDPVIINNYYNNNAGWSRWNGPEWNLGFGWNSWGGNFWNAGYGWGGWYDPLWNPWFYAPFRGPLWGWNSWGWNNAWCPPGYYSGFGTRRAVFVSDNVRRGRTIVRGPRSSRGGEVSSSGRSRTAGESSITNNLRNEPSRHSAQQRAYLTRSRNSRYSNSISGINSRNTRSRNPTLSTGNSSGRRGNAVNQRSRINPSDKSSSYNNGSGSRSKSSNFGTSGSSRSSGSSRVIRPGRSSQRSGSIRPSGSPGSRSSGRSRSSSGRLGSRSRRGN